VCSCRYCDLIRHCQFPIISCACHRQQHINLIPTAQDEKPYYMISHTKAFRHPYDCSEVQIRIYLWITLLSSIFVLSSSSSSSSSRRFTIQNMTCSWANGTQSNRTQQLQAAAAAAAAAAARELNLSHPCHILLEVETIELPEDIWYLVTTTEDRAL